LSHARRTPPPKKLCAAKDEGRGTGIGVIRIIGAKEAHIPDILRIERGSFAAPWTEGTLTDMLFRPDVCFAVAADGGEALGFVILQAGGGESELYQIAVRADARRRGIAGSLLGPAVEFARGRQSERVFLEVRESNIHAQRLYEKYGFVIVGRRKNYYFDPREDAVVMSKKLMDGENE